MQIVQNAHMPGPRSQVLIEHETRFSLKAVTWPVLTV